MSIYESRVAIVILHYNAIDDTIECVESIFETFNHNDFHVIIIDNDSPNGSGKILKEKYGDNNRIHLIFSEANLGFAKGNNLGYSYAKEELKVDFIVIPNNDTVFVDENFVSRMFEIYSETEYGVLGPDIQSLRNDEHQNPHRLKLVDLNQINTEIAYMKKEQKKLGVMSKYDFPWVYSIMRKVKRKIISIKNGSKINHSKEIPTQRMYDVTLHGACLIFSPMFIKVYDYAFYPEPFIYLDEDHLHYMCHKQGLKMIYDPSFKILHKEDRSTETVMNTNLKKSMFINENMLASAEILKRLMEEDGFISS